MSKKFSNVNLNSLAGRAPAPACNPSQRTGRTLTTPSRGLVSLGPSKPAAVKKPASAWGKPREEPEPAPEEKVEPPPEDFDTPEMDSRPPEEVPETPEIAPEKTIPKKTALSWADASEVWEDRDEWLLRSKTAKAGGPPVIEETHESRPEGNPAVDRPEPRDAWQESRPQESWQAQESWQVSRQDSRQDSWQAQDSRQESWGQDSRRHESWQGQDSRRRDSWDAQDTWQAQDSRQDSWQAPDTRQGQDSRRQPHDSHTGPKRSPQNLRLQQDHMRQVEQTRGTVAKGGSNKGSPREFEVQNVPSTALVMNLTHVLKRLHGSCSIQQLLKALPSLKEKGVSVESFLLSHSHVFELKGRIVYLKDAASEWEPTEEEDWSKGGKWQEDWREDRPDAPTRNGIAKGSQPKKATERTERAERAERRAHHDVDNSQPRDQHKGSAHDDSPRPPQRARDRQRQEKQQRSKEWNGAKPQQEDNANTRRQGRAKEHQEGKKKGKGKAQNSGTADDNWRQGPNERTETQEKSHTSERNRKKDKDKDKDKDKEKEKEWSSQDWKDWNGWGDNDWSKSGNGKKWR